MAARKNKQEEQQGVCLKRYERVLRTLICVAVQWALAFSAFYMIAEAGHDCTGEHCAACRQIELCKNLLRTLTLFCAVSATAGDTAAMLCCRQRGHSTKTRVPTLVSLMVELSD